MKFGIFDFEVIKVRDLTACTNPNIPKLGIWFQPTLKIGNTIIQTFGLWKREKDAFNAGIKKLTELFQGALDQLPKYQIKSKPVDAIQWNGEKIEGISLVHYHYYYNDQYIHSGDWIVDGKIVTNEEFKENYEPIR